MPASADDLEQFILEQFDDACIQNLARTARFPADADLAPFAKGIREAVHIYLRDAAIPTHNEINAAIAELHRAADRYEYERVATLLDKLVPEARDLLQIRGVLPQSSELSNANQRDGACATVAMICRIGGGQFAGRMAKLKHTAQTTAAA